MYEDLEEQRVALQALLDSRKTALARNRLGQFATPGPLAMEMLRLCRTLLPSDMSVRFLDPAFGTGAFYSALLRSFSSAQIASANGYEVDPHYGLPAQQLWQPLGLHLTLADFTALDYPDDPAQKVNLLVCNPPYVRHHHLAADDKARLQAKILAATGLLLSGLAGLYNYFLLMCHAWLDENGLACWLIPNEVLDVNYGVEVKRYLLEQVTLLRVHQFNADKVQFADALVSSVVIWYRKSPAAPGHTVEFTYGPSLSEPQRVQSVARHALRAEAKWSQIYRSVPAVLAAADEDSSLRLEDLFDIKRGLATGANEFFILTEAQAQRHRLEREFLKPILPAPRHLPHDEVLADALGQPMIDPQLYLIDCSWAEDEVRSRAPYLWTYLSEGERQGIHTRYLSSHRTPWYSQEQRPPARLLCTYMGRQTASKDQRAFRFIYNHSAATASNVYLLLYPKPHLQRLVRANPTLLHELWQMLRKIDGSTVIGEGRTYGGKLHKIEPRELGNLPLPQVEGLGLCVDHDIQMSLFDT